MKTRYLSVTPAVRSQLSSAIPAGLQDHWLRTPGANGRRCRHRITISGCTDLQTVERYVVSSPGSLVLIAQA